MSSVWFVTGSSRGLGRSIVAAALAAGDRVVATARNPAALDDLVAVHGERLRALPLDVTDPVAVRRAVDDTRAAFGRIDVVVNNAGYANVAPFETHDMDDYRAQLEANFFGTVNVTQAVLPILREQGSGRLIPVTTIGVRAGTPGLSAYQAAKRAVEGFSEAVDRELRPLGIRTTIVEPGGMRTDWAGSSMEIAEIPEAYRPTVGMIADAIRERDGQQPVDPDRVAAAIVRIAKTDDPPLRLLMGTDAVDIAKQATAATAAEDAAWEELAGSVDFEGSPNRYIPAYHD
jgi:NAD(P)-dependent dehydrogenase (short-subunit alcohol dehydrogenase family)